MRGMRTIFAWAFIVTALAFLSTSAMAQSYLLMGVTNQIWKYNQTDAFNDAAWAGPGFDDSAWPQGFSVLGFEPSQPAAAFIRTPLVAPNAAGGRLTYYFRTHFTIPSGVDPSTLILTSSNFLDDGAVFYFNGQEAMRWNVAAGTPSTYTTAQISANPAPCGDAQRCVLVLTNAAAFLQAGDNLMAVEVKGGGTGSSDVTWGTDLHAVVSFAPRITDAAEPRDTNVVQCKSATLRVVASGAPTPAYQWYKDFAQIPGATAPTYTITNMTSADAGQYYCNVANNLGSVDSRIATVTYTADNIPPTIVRAQADPTDLTIVVVTFSEPVANSGDPFNWTFDCKDPFNCPGSYVVQGAVPNAAGDAITLTIDPPRDPAYKYTITPVPSTMSDTCSGNVLVDGTFDVIVPTVFRNGVSGYTGTQDTELRSDTPDVNTGARADFVNIDLSDGTPAGPTEGLLRFDNIVGNGPGQIPPGATVNSIQLVLPSSGGNANGDLVEFHRMLVDWSQATATWNSMNGGITADGAEASTTIDASYATTGNTVPFVVTRTDNGLKATVQAWVNGAPNFGWAILPTGGDGYRIDTSENASVNQRPMLIVDFTVQSGVPCNITQDPANTTVAEGNNFTLSVVSAGSGLTYQWFKNNVAISGATASSYTKKAVAGTGGDGGTYKVVIHDDSNHTCTSGNALVTVQGDNTRDNVVSAIGNADGTITVTFDDDMLQSSAQTPGNYILNGGVTVSSAVYTNRTVTLTTTPRTPGTTYTLTVQNVRDDSAAGNLVNPRTFNPLEYRVNLLAMGATWKYDNNGCDLGPAGWTASAYNDSAWPSATAPLGRETTPVVYGNLGLNTNNLGLLIRTNSHGCGVVGTNGIAQNMVDYFRTTINIPFNPAGALIVVRHVIDDGAVFYFNGVEAGRFNMTNGPVTNLTPAPGTMTEGVIRGQVLNGSALHSGANTFAVEVHQDAPASSDVVLGVEVNAYYGVARPKLDIVPDGPGNIVISWSPKTGILQTNSMLNGFWSDAPSQANPQTNSAVGNRVYSIRP